MRTPSWFKEAGLEQTFLKTLAIFFPANIMGTRVVWQAVLMV
jgi:hypothetical protein